MRSMPALTSPSSLAETGFPPLRQAVEEEITSTPDPDPCPLKKTLVLLQPLEEDEGHLLAEVGPDLTWDEAKKEPVESRSPA